MSMNDYAIEQEEKRDYIHEREDNHLHEIEERDESLFWEVA